MLHVAIYVSLYTVVVIFDVNLYNVLKETCIHHCIMVTINLFIIVCIIFLADSRLEATNEVLENIILFNRTKNIEN